MLARKTAAFQRPWIWLGLGLAMLAVLVAVSPSAQPTEASPTAEPTAAPPAAPPDPPAKAAPAAAGEAKLEGSSMQDLEIFFADGRFAAAAELAARLRAAAVARGDQEEATRLLIREVQAQAGLGASETALRLLLEAEEPRQKAARLVYLLFRAETLSRYFDAYSWQIRQREESGPADRLGVDKWTADQLDAAILASFAGAWEQRAEWNTESVGPLAGLLEQNDYPARIRGTLRDTLSYLFAQSLANSSRFTPEQGNELHRLDLELLLGPAAPAAPGAVLAPGLHPLERLALVLGDLEAWHRAKGRPEAALEARIARLDSLRVHFSSAEDRERFDRALSAELDSFPGGLEWRAMGFAKLAEWRRESDAPDALRRAHQAAKEGVRTFPESLGGRRSRAILDQLEMPSLNVEASLTDGPRRPSLSVTHANLKRLHLRAYPAPHDSQVSAPVFRGQAKDLAELMRAAAPVAEWQAELEDPGDFRQHRTHLTPPLDRIGHYVVVVSERPDFPLENNRIQAVQMWITELVVVGRPLFKTAETEVEVRSGRAGTALPGTQVDLLANVERRSYAKVASQETDAEGRAIFDLTPVAQNTQLYLAVSRGEDRISTGGWIQRPWMDKESEKVEQSQLIFSDRGVYRPGQKILFKVISYRLDKKSRTRKVAPEADLNLELTDANGEVVASRQLRTNRHGSASGEFEVPAGRRLGDWILRSSGTWHRIKVEEYKRPTFELAIEDPAAPLRLNQEARLEGSARYYFGMPLRDGKVSWRVTREPAYPRWWYWWPPVREVQTVASGSGQLDAEGRFAIAFLPRADERLAATPGGREIAYRYRIYADLTDQGGETRSAERAFKAGFVMVDASLEPAAEFFEPGEKIEVVLRRFDLDGKGRAGGGSWRLLRVAAGAPLLPADLPDALPFGSERSALPGDRLPPRHRAVYDEAKARRLLADGAEVARGEIAAGENGQARLELPARFEPGLYRLRYATADEAGAKIERSAEILVARKKMPGVGLAVVLEAETEKVDAGGELRLLAGSGLEQTPAVLEIFRGEKRVFRRELPPGELSIVGYKVAAEDRGGLVAEIRAVADHQLLVLRREIAVPVDQEKLAVSFGSFRDRLRPGQKERFTIEVKSLDGSSLDPRLVEILSYMYDRSLDVFAPPPSASPFRSFFENSQVQGPQSSLRHSWPFFRAERQPPGGQYPQLREDRLVFFDQVGFGGGMDGGIHSGMMLNMASAESMPLRRGQAADLDEKSAGSAEPVMVPEAPGDSASAPPPPPPPPPPQAQPAPAAPEMRESFAETAYFEPHLEPGDDGKVSFEFEVPDSVTEWNVFTHALADDFRYGSDSRTTRTVKELLVRPYLPRFLREGDRAELRISVDNTGDTGLLEGKLDLDLLDEESGASLLADFGLDRAAAAGRPFRVEPGKSDVLVFPFVVPSRLGAVVLRVSGSTAGRAGGELSDGEQRLLPILPARLHLAQSLFAVLREPGSRQLEFEDLRRDDDPSRVDEKMVLTLDGQLFTSVLRALPYLVDYPYHCTEQTLNRFVSTGILTGLFDRYPAIASLAKKLASRETPLEPLPAADPNRVILLEETPWLAASRGGQVPPAAELERILDPRIARAVRDGAIDELKKAQDPSGGFPWWPGGPPSTFFTLYLLQGFARAGELGAEMPRESIERAWIYLAREMKPELEKLKDPKGARELWYQAAWLNYVLSTYPDLSWTGNNFTEEDRAVLLDASLLHWKELPRRARLYLALTAHRAGRPADAQRVLESVMDGARTLPDQGTFWQPEERAWLFWWDRIETHALALRTLMEIAPKDERRHGLVTWLMLNKKLNQWNSTRSTAEVIHALVGYLEAEGQLGVPERASVVFGGKRESFVFEPDRDQGRRQIELEGAAIEPARDAKIEIAKETPGLLFASATWHFSTEKLPAEARGDFFGVRRAFYRRVFEKGRHRLEPLAEGAKIAVGDELEVQLEIEAKHQAEYVHLRDPRGAGFEPVDLVSSWRWELGISHFREIRDSATNFFFENLPAGKMTLAYRLRAATAGTFRVGPATLQSMYAPEFAAYSAGERLEVAP